MSYMTLGQEKVNIYSNEYDTIPASKEPPLILIDNCILDLDSMKNMDPNDIGEIKVMKPDNDYVNQYGEKARNGVLLIKTKKLVAREWFSFFYSIAKSKELKAFIENDSFNYTDFKDILNSKELETDFFVKLKLTENDVKSIKFKKLNVDKTGFKGIIVIHTYSVNA